MFDVHQIFRAGGDEFVVILTGITEETLAARAGMLRQAASHYKDLHFAIGTAFTAASAKIRRTLRTADERMYADKSLYYELHPEKKRSTDPR